MPGVLRVSLAALLAALFAACVAHAAPIDPPDRVARLSDVQGRVSFSPAGEDAWFGVIRNRPLVRGDRLWVDRGARAELQVGSAAVRLGPGTGVEILELDDRIVQLQLTEGALNVRVRRLHQGQTFEIATPLLAFVIEEPGRYRIDVDRRGEQTDVAVHEGAGVAYGERSSFPIEAGEAVQFFDTDLRDYALQELPAADGFDRYAMERDRRLDRSVSLRYVDPDLIGYADLDDYGRWQQTSDYGAVWFPSRVAADWAPYRDGRWIWQEPWGWTWVDDAPWGFAPSHYGRWVFTSSRWGWIPGPRNRRPVYAPALVAFVSGRGWNVSASRGTPVGWFPLGPRDVYVPSYRASRDYFARVNAHNAAIEQARIADLYARYTGGAQRFADPGYANRGVRGAVTVAPATVFSNGRPVREELLRLDHETVLRGEIARGAQVAPSMQSIVGAGVDAAPPPSADAFDRRTIARHAPPPEMDSFAERRRQLERTPGLPPEWRGREGRTVDPNVQVVDPRGANARLGEPRRDRGERRRDADPGQDVAGDERRGGERGERGGRGRFEGERVDGERAVAEQQRLQQERQRQQDEQQRIVEQQQRGEQQRQLQLQLEQQRQHAEQQRLVDQQRGEQQRELQVRQEQQRLADQQRAEQQRQVEDQQRQQAEQRRLAEQQQRQLEDQQRQQAEQERIAAQQQAEQQRQQEEQQRRQEEQQRVAEQQAEQQRQREQQQAEREQRIAEQRERMEQLRREREAAREPVADDEER